MDSPGSSGTSTPSSGSPEPDIIPSFPQSSSSLSSTKRRLASGNSGARDAKSRRKDGEGRKDKDHASFATQHAGAGSSRRDREELLDTVLVEQLRHSK
jgi:hypothetical protein